MAEELAAFLGQSSPVIRLSVDDYHRPPEERYRRGRDSPEGYYHDAFDYPKFLAALQDTKATADTVLLVDGVFLFRPELNDAWDYRIFVHVDLDLAYERGIRRDASWMGGEEEARRRYAARYIPGERLYLDAVQPASLADVVFDNTNPASPACACRDNPVIARRPKADAATCGGPGGPG